MVGKAKKLIKTGLLLCSINILKVNSFNTLFSH